MLRIDAAGGVLYRTADTGTEIMMIFRRGVWDLPKGKKEETESFRECAVREVAEETGMEVGEPERHLTDTRHEYVLDGEHVAKTTKWYSMKPVDPGADPVPQHEEEIELARWTGISEARKMPAYDNLIAVINAFERKVTAGRQF
jgi:8-oxo-dGTP pyrophosphatase MutT (NUDIX family)